MDNEPKLRHWLEPHAHPNLSQQEIKDMVGSTNCANTDPDLHTDPTMRPMRRDKLLLTTKQKDYIALRTETIEIPFDHNPVCHRKPIILSHMETNAINNITIACQPINASQIQQKHFALTVFRTDLFQLREAIHQYHKIARAFELYCSLDVMELKQRWNNTLLPYPMSHCVHCLRHSEKYDLDPSLQYLGTFEDWAVKLVQLLWLGCNSEPKCLHCHIGLSKHPATKCDVCRNKFHYKCLVQCGLRIINGKRKMDSDRCGGTYCSDCMQEFHQCRISEIWNIDAQEHCRDVSTVWDPKPNGTTWRELGPDQPQPDLERSASRQPDSKRRAL